MNTAIKAYGSVRMRALACSSHCAMISRICSVAMFAGRGSGAKRRDQLLQGEAFWSNSSVTVSSAHGMLTGRREAQEVKNEETEQKEQAVCCLVGVGWGGGARQRAFRVSQVEPLAQISVEPVSLMAPSWTPENQQLQLTNRSRLDYLRSRRRSSQHVSFLTSLHDLCHSHTRNL